MSVKPLSCCLLFISFSFIFSPKATAECAKAGQNQSTQPQPDQRQQVHSREINHGVPDQIPQLLANTTGDVYLRTAVNPPLVVVVADSLGSLMNMTCESDLVVLGKVGNGTAHATVDQGYIYTDWDLTIEETLKNNVTSPVEAGQTIVVTRPGGVLSINGRHVYALDNDFRQFQSGSEVLLYLHYLPSTATYSLRRPNGFEISGSKIINLARIGYIQSDMMQTSDLLDLARKAAADKCPARAQQ